ncbi:MAG TPA: hypothetical protein VF077_08835 [Nitrospiraceae bacterium]
MNKPRLTPEEWETLKASPAGEALRIWALEEIEELRGMWEGGNLTAESDFKTKANNFAAIGACRILRTVAALEYETICGDSSEPTVKLAAGPGE